MRTFFDDEGGFTTAGAAVALLLVFTLAFAGLHAFWTSSRSGDIQYVADAGALAADNAVAEFVTAGQAVDAVLLSMSLLALTTYSAAAVAAFIPGAQEVSGKLIETGAKIQKAQHKAAKMAAKALDAAQKALPALCVARATACISANSGGDAGACYGFAVPVPLEGIAYEPPDSSEVEEAGEVIEEEQDEVCERSKEQEDLEKKMNAAKKAAWEADCGKAGMNMRERAGHLGGLSGAHNPDYSSPETWTFAAALKRAKAYYQARYSAEGGSWSSGSPELVGESVARKRFYSYAYETVSRGYVNTSDSGMEMPHFEILARNTDQIRSTGLYTESIYPVCAVDGKSTLHAYTGCPEYAKGAPNGTASVSAIDSGAVDRCPVCNYSATTLGRVPSASTSIDNGFEYYYKEVAEQANRYSEDAKRVQELQDKLEKSRKKMTEKVQEAFKSIAAKRYDPQPPGRYGCICVVYGAPAKGPQGGFASGQAELGQRIAISGATLAADPDSDQGNIIRQIGENALPEDFAGSGVVETVFGAWGSALQFYTDANKGTSDMLKKTLGAVPVVGNDLSEWALSGFKKAVSGAGLDPPDLKTYKPVLVNTSHIASHGDGKLASLLLDMKKVGQGYADAQVGDLRALAATVDLPQEVQDFISEDGLTLLEVPLSKYGLGLQDLRIKIGVPEDLMQRASQALVQAQGG